MFITFTKEYEHFKDNILNGFMMNEHMVSFKPSLYDLIQTLFDFWTNYDIQGVAISEIRKFYQANGGFTPSFWKEFGEKMSTDRMFNINVSFLIQNINANIKMKCFTEIRDNQKINPLHTGHFGDFGILMKHTWVTNNGGSPVIYVGGDMNLTKIIGRSLSMMSTLNDSVTKLANVRSLDSMGAFFDLFSFFEISENKYEYEWRIPCAHRLGGRSFLPDIDRLNFKLSDVHSFYLPTEELMSDFLNFINANNINNETIPAIFLTSEIVLNTAEINEIRRIQTR